MQHEIYVIFRNARYKPAMINILCDMKADVKWKAEAKCGHTLQNNEKHVFY